MLKKNKKIVALLFSLILICGTVYANYEFLKGHIFAEMDEDTGESISTSSAESSSEENNLETSSLTESQEEVIQPQQAENIVRGMSDSGWEVGAATNIIEKNGNKISWMNGGSWWYTYNNNSWVYNTSIEATLIINGSFLAGTSENTSYGFLWGSISESVYSINPAANMLKRSFPYKTYQIDIIQQLLEDGAVEISYQVTNKNNETQKIGISQYVDILDSSLIRVLNDFKGLNMTNTNSLAMMPEPETMPNWSTGSYGSLKGFSGYSPKTVDGIGWEVGKKQPDSSVNLKENQPMALGDSGAIMKNQGVLVAPGESTIFKQIVKFGGMIPPDLTVDQKTGSMYTNESFDITGTISDNNNQNYRLYLELDDAGKTLVPLKDFKNIPFQEVQNYQATIEGKYFTQGNHTVSIIGIDEYGARSVEQNLTFAIREVSGVPLVQKVKLGEGLNPDLTTLFKDIKGNGTKLKNIAEFDTTNVGFQWVEATLIDDDLKEGTFKIPVSIYNPVSTVFNETDKISLNAKNIGFTVSEIDAAIKENRLNELILRESEAKAWQMEDGVEAILSVPAHTIKAQIGNYEATIRATRIDTNKTLEKKISFSVTNAPLQDGWEFGTANDVIEKTGNKINWNNGNWWYTYNNNSWVYGTSIEAALIVNGSFLAGTSENTNGGFLWANLAESVYTKNLATNTLKRSFPYKTYQIDILQKMLDEGSVEVSYQVTNKASVPQKIGVSQYVDILDSSPIRVLNSFKGLNMTNTNSLAMMPDTETMPNWSTGSYGSLRGFSGYSPKTANGAGWESGKKQPDSSVELKENKSLGLGDSGAIMKNPGVMVQPDESTTFKQILKFGGMIPPTVTVNQKSEEMYTSESVDITGTISDVNNHNYRLYLEMDDTDKTLIPLKDFTNVPYKKAQDYQVAVEGKYFTKGSHTVAIVGIDEYGAQSEAKTMSFTIKEVSGVPLIQKVKIGGKIQTDITKLFENIVGNGTKLKSVSEVDSTTVGFKWVEAILIDSDLKEEVYKVPVAVYDDKTTIFNDVDNIVLDVKNIGLTSEEITKANQENRLTELILQQSEAKAWQAENGEEAIVTVLSHDVKPKIGSYTATIRATRTDTNKILEKKVTIYVTYEPLKDGWEFGLLSDAISNNGYKIEWNNGRAWWYTYNGSKWMYDKAIEANLIINGVFPTNTSDVVGSGFLWKSIDESVYSINKETNSLRRTFYYLDKYKIDIIQQLLGNNAVEITYEVTNLGIDTQKIGISQYVDTYVGSDSVPVTPINNFEGINLTSGQSSLAIIPDSKTMPNWTAGVYSITQNFKQYSTQNADGLGWETGKRYRDAVGSLYPSPVELKENQPVNLGDSGVSMKNPGVNVRSNESVSFKQILKYGVLAAPQVTVNQEKASMYQDEKIVIDGTISDADNMNYRMYLEMDDKDKTLIQLASYTDIPYNDVQNYQGTIEGKDFSPGIHTVSVIGIDEYGTRSVAQKIELTITELKGEPNIQKVKIGEAISNDLKTLFKEVKGTNVTLKNPLSIDSSIIGFQWVEATLTDGKQKEITERIPVNVYNPESTVFNEVDNLVLDAKNTSFELADVRQSAEEGALDDLVYQKVSPKAWNMEDGIEIPVELIKNGIEPVFGNYSATFKGTRVDSGASLQKVSQLAVGGELKFKELPKKLDYKTTKLSQKTPYVERMHSDWKIEIENTIGSNWSLFASAIPFEDQAKEKLRSALVLKKSQTQDVVINGTSQKIATGSETFPTIQWAETAGLLLKVSPDAKVGSYQGEVTWLLSDAP
ncbi:hypothetical protein [Carnobacterium maltaromaticum]|uniref:hypothetical protein n=1 Tax=Carnobacterium maltaromaticum TaxID=2751 RepID=UPI0039BECE84